MKYTKIKWRIDMIVRAMRKVQYASAMRAINCAIGDDVKSDEAFFETNGDFCSHSARASVIVFAISTFISTPMPENKMKNELQKKKTELTVRWRHLKGAMQLPTIATSSKRGHKYIKFYRKFLFRQQPKDNIALHLRPCPSAPLCRPPSPPSSQLYCITIPTTKSRF